MTNFGGPILFDPRIEERIKQHWPNVCDTCGCVADKRGYCVSPETCRKGSRAGHSKYFALIDCRTLEEFEEWLRVYE